MARGGQVLLCPVRSMVSACFSVLLTLLCVSPWRCLPATSPTVTAPPIVPPASAIPPAAPAIPPAAAPATPPAAAIPPAAAPATPPAAIPPVAAPPAELVSGYTLNGVVPIEMYYVDDSNGGKGTHYKFTEEDIKELIAEAGSLVKEALQYPSPPAPSQVKHGTWLRQLSDLWLIHALHEFDAVSGKHLVVYGSTSPWYESIVLSMGAASVTVIEYNQLTYDHPSITTVLIGETNTSWRFDTALSITSFDHDGLGRYGDPLNPDGDLAAMSTAASMLKPHGLMFLTVPIGPDVLVWNLHRRYGHHRLPLLLKGWEQVAVYGWREELLEAPAPFTITYEPVLVLRHTQNKK